MHISCQGVTIVYSTLNFFIQGVTHVDMILFKKMLESVTIVNNSMIL